MQFRNNAQIELLIFLERLPTIILCDTCLFCGLSCLISLLASLDFVTFFLDLLFFSHFFTPLMICLVSAQSIFVQISPIVMTDSPGYQLL